MTCTGARLAAFFAMDCLPSVPRGVRRYRIGAVVPMHTHALSSAASTGHHA